MSSGPSVILVITKGETGDTIIEEWRELIGPKAVEEAKEKAPDRYDVWDVLTLVAINLFQVIEILPHWRQGPILWRLKSVSHYGLVMSYGIPEQVIIGSGNTVKPLI